MFNLELVQCWNCFYEDLAETAILEEGFRKECPCCGKEMLTEDEMYAHQESLASRSDDSVDLD